MTKKPEKKEKLDTQLVRGIDPEVKKIVAMYAASKGLSVNQVIVDLLTRQSKVYKKELQKEFKI